ncbi:MAG: class I SAM-dependent methyltransferase [Acidobacteria bacterium]|nr:class I SAM-dependent methyltransferase [Acidobacteriota bacterium]
MKLFRSNPTSVPGAKAQARPTRRSSAMAELTRLLKSEEPLCVLDIGPTSAANIRFFTEGGHRIYSQDLLEASSDPGLVIEGAEGTAAVDSKKFLEENLPYPNAHFDLVLCWNLADYLDETLVKPVVGRLWSMMKPGAMLLAFFHTREAGPDAPFYRYHVTGSDLLEVHALNPRNAHRKEGTLASSAFRLQRVFNNRHIENLFRDFASIKFFLSRDNIREVLVVR